MIHQCLVKPGHGELQKLMNGSQNGLRSIVTSLWSAKISHQDLKSWGKKKNTEFSMTKINLRSYFDCYVDNEKRNWNKRSPSGQCYTQVVSEPFGCQCPSNILENQKRSDHIWIKSCTKLTLLPSISVQIFVDAVQKEEEISVSMNVKFLTAVIFSCLWSSALILLSLSS